MVNYSNNIVLKRFFRKETVSLFLNIVFLLYSATFLLESGIHRLCIYLSTLLWVIEGDFRRKFQQILEQKVILLYFGVILCFLFSLTFISENINQGFWYEKYSNGYDYILKKGVFFFLIAIYISTSLKEKFIKWILYAYVLQMLFFSIYFTSIYFKIIKSSDIIPFGLHYITSSFAILLSISIIIYLYLIKKNIIIRLFLISLGFFFIFNILILNGRNAYLTLVIIIIQILYFLFKNKMINSKSLILILIVFLVSLVFVYKCNDKVYTRINLTKENILEIINKNNTYSPLGIRFILYKTSYNLLMYNPRNFIFGLGMGDTKKEFSTYIKKNNQNELHVIKQPHVHNQYLQTWIDGGILALIFYIAIFIFLYKLDVAKLFKFHILITITIFIIYGISDIIYHNSNILGLYSLFIGLFLASNNFLKSNNIL